MNDREMLPVLTPRDMKRTEQNAFSRGVPSLLLMEHAAQTVTDALENMLGSCAGKRVLFLCGPGNNGGDGMAAARLFHQRGGAAHILLTAEPKTEEAKTQLQWARQISGIAIDIHDGGALPTCDGIVDALLGTGLKGAPDGKAAALIRAANESGVPVLAVDIPSGMDGETGACTPDACIRAAVTVTFHAPKPGLYLTGCRENVGKIEIADIGLWDMAWLLPDDREPECELLLPPLLRRLAPRKLNAHKGDFGRVLIYAGSLGMAGAAIMCAKAAVTAGAGRTTVACPREIMPILQSAVPNAMCVDIAKAVQNPPAYDVLALGPGLTDGEEIWQNILALYDPNRPSVWDADALNLLARHEQTLGEKAIITPHPGEAARLLHTENAAVTADRFAAARALWEKYGCTALLKGDVSVLAHAGKRGTTFALNASGTPALAKGGSGDVLCGIIAALLVNHDPWEAAALGSLWHGLAGAVGEKKYGQIELTGEQQIASLWDARKAYGIG